MTGEKDLFAEGADKAPVSTPTPDDADKQYLGELVGEGRKYADAEALAKSKFHADAHIAQVEMDNEELRQELQKRSTVEEVYDRMRQDRNESTHAPSNPDNTNDPGEQTSNAQPEISDIRSLVKEAVGEYVTAETTNKNKDYVLGELERRLGPNFQTIMHQKAKALGETTVDLTALAVSKPKLFLELVAPGTSSKETFQPPPHTDINSAAPRQSGQRDSNYYAELKKSNSTEYFSKKVRVQMMDDAMKLGEAFFK